MFEAMVLVCLTISSNSCFEAVDTRGPYKELKECMVRIDEMKRDLHTLPNHKVESFQCKLGWGI